MTKKNTSNVNNYYYNEAQALQELLQAIDDAYEENNCDDTEVMCMEEHISITIGNKHVAFILGGPQIQGLCDFVKCIAKDNLYEVDFNENTVLA